MSRTAGDDLDQMNFAQLLQLARQLNVPGRGTARVGQLRDGIRTARTAARRSATQAARTAARTAPAAQAPAAEAAWIPCEPQEPNTLVIDTPAGKIRVGSVIVASAWLGGNARYTVLEVGEDIKNGYAGWEAEGRWGYADQVLRVVKF